MLGKDASMKRIVSALIVLGLTACAMPDLSYLLPSVPPTATATSTPTVTLAPGETRLPTDTLTPSETPTETPQPATATSAFTRTPTKRPTITFEPSELGQFGFGSPIFMTILASSDTIRWGACGGAGPFEIKFTVRVNRPKKLHYVLLFMRLQDKYTYLRTDWFGGAIMTADKNKVIYTYTITNDNITNYEDFDEAWLQYQIVAADSYRNILGSSLVYLDKINVIHCATPTPKP
jgi:hypothetical protein